MVDLLAPLPTLAFTERQRQVAMRLGISARTARAHADIVRQKLGVDRRRQIPLAYREATGADLLEPLVAHAAR
jgi:DNA-binding NarL/FixJ family response regulator